VYSGSDIARVPKKPGVYSLVRSVKNQSTTEWVYTGMSGNLRERVGQHLLQQTGTYSGNKNAASVNLERLTHVRWWDISHIDWPDDVTTEYVDSKKQVKVAKKGEKDWKQFLAGAAEIIIKNRYPPMIDDQAKPKGLAPDVAKSPKFQEEIEKIIEKYSETELPSLENLHRRINQMDSRILALEKLIENLDTES